MILKMKKKVANILAVDLCIEICEYRKSMDDFFFLIQVSSMIAPRWLNQSVTFNNLSKFEL